MNKTIKALITLVSPLNKTLVPIQIDYDEDTNLSEITIIYNSVKYQAKGKDYLWNDTFANLQKMLPKDVKITCCMTCRHGNMCPYGNTVNELFCTKDLTVNSKEDMCDLFDKTDPYSKCRVFSFNCCDDFIYQSNDYYTYNDFLYHLQKKESELY